MSTPTNVAARELQELLGDADDLIIERVMETGASLDEVVEALADLEDERGFGEAPHVPSSSRVAEVRAILEELYEASEETEPQPLEGARS